MTTEEFHWTSRDGVKIYAKEWRVQFPKAVIALVHGLGEHCNRYNHVAAFFAQHNIATLAYDRRGHGQSAGQRGHSKKYEYFLEEVDELLRQAGEKYPLVPVFLYGHIMGGNIVLKYLLDRQPNVTGAVVTGAFIRFAEAPSPLLLNIGRLMRRIYPAFSQSNDLDPDGVSRDPAVVQAYKNDPLVHDKISSGTAIGMIEVAKELDVFDGTFQKPLLIMHGTADKVTGYDGSKQFANRVSGPVLFKAWPDAYHELHNEPNQQEVLEFTLEWMRQQL